MTENTEPGKIYCGRSARKSGRTFSLRRSKSWDLVASGPLGKYETSEQEPNEISESQISVNSSVLLQMKTALCGFSKTVHVKASGKRQVTITQPDMIFCGFGCQLKYAISDVM